MASMTRRHYTEEFKRETVGLIKGSGKSHVMLRWSRVIADFAGDPLDGHALTLQPIAKLSI